MPWLLILLLASLVVPRSAHAVDIFFTNLEQTGARITVDLVLDTLGRTDLESVFVSVKADPRALSFVAGTSPSITLFELGTFDPILGTGTFRGLSKASDPFVLGSDPFGRVRAANFFNDLGPGHASGCDRLARLTFDILGDSAGALSVLLQAGDQVIAGGADLSGDLQFRNLVGVFGGIATTFLSPIECVPEPSMALLIGLGLAVLSSRHAKR